MSEVQAFLIEEYKDFDNLKEVKARASNDTPTRLPKNDS